MASWGLQWFKGYALSPSLYISAYDVSDGAWHACNAYDAWSSFDAHELYVMHDSNLAHPCMKIDIRYELQRRNSSKITHN